MSLSTLLEAAKYLDYLETNPQQQGQAQQQQQQQTIQLTSQQQQQQQQYQKALPTPSKRSIGRRQRSSKKDAANTMVAMSLPTSTGTIQMQQGVPIPLASGSGVYGGAHHHASLSSSFTTESPLSSFASTALLCSKASGVTSASSSAASSLSSSDSSSSCGEILMGDNDSSQATATRTTIRTNGRKGTKQHKATAHQQQIETDSHHLKPSFANHHEHSNVLQKFSPGSYNDRGQSFARYIAATSTGPQLVTMTTDASGGVTSASAPIDGRLRAGHVIHAATQNSQVCNAAFDHHQYSLQAAGFHTTTKLRDNNNRTTTFLTTDNSLGSSDNHSSTSPNGSSCHPPLIMTRVQPMILNSISPSAHQSLMAFQPTSAVAASSPTSSSSSYSRHRELHKTLEKNRRAHLRHCFELLKSELPISECVDKKTSHINIIKSAIRYVLALRQQECELDNELAKLSKVKNELTEKLSVMRGCISSSDDQQMQQINHMIQQATMTTTTINKRAHEMTSSIKPADNDVQSHSERSDGTNSMMNSASPPVVLSSPASPDATPMKFEQQSPQQPAAEQQLSFLLSQSKID